MKQQLIDKEVVLDIFGSVILYCDDVDEAVNKTKEMVKPLLPVEAIPVEWLKKIKWDMFKDGFVDVECIIDEVVKRWNEQE